jgi:hypothetical protein
MPQQQGFSIASVVLSYFLVGGGMFTGMLIAGFAKVTSDVVVYVIMAAGAFLGGFVAGRASRGATILEPAIGAIAVIGTIVGLAAGTEIGKFLWHVDSDGTMKFVGLVGGLAAGGALAGAFASEKLLGESTLSAAPWIIYSALATFGACVLATVIATFIVVGSSATNADSVASGLIAGLASGCIIAGVSIGVSARKAPHGGAFLGGVLGTGGFALLVTRAGGEGGSQDEFAILGVFALGGGIATLIGCAIGWAVLGKSRQG